VPNAPSATTLHRAIKKTAAKHNSPTFHPHVPLFSLNQTDKTVEELAKAMKPVVAGVKSPISLEEAGVQVGATFHQSVYLALKPVPELTALRDSLLRAVNPPAETESGAFPHAPLYYGAGSNEDKHHVVAQMMDACTVDIRHDGLIEVTGLQSRLDLSEVWIVHIASEHPESWKVLHKEAIAGAEIANSLPPSPVSPITASSRQNTDGGTNSSPTMESPPSPAKAVPTSPTNGSTTAPGGSTSAIGKVSNTPTGK